MIGYKVAVDKVIRRARVYKGGGGGGREFGDGEGKDKGVVVGKGAEMGAWEGRGTVLRRRLIAQAAVEFFGSSGSSTMKAERGGVLFAPAAL